MGAHFLRRGALLTMVLLLLPSALPGQHAPSTTAGAAGLPAALRNALTAQTISATADTSTHHGMGLRLSPRAENRHNKSVVAGSYPDTYDLSTYNPPVGNQGQVNSCASWSTGYNLRGWYANQAGNYPPAGNGRPAGFAPMYLYSQVDGGADQGSTLEDNMSTMASQGIDTRADYSQGDYDWRDQPTQAEKQNAGAYTISGYTANYDQQSLSLEYWIKSRISGGNPVVIAIPVYNNFENANSTNYVINGDGNGQLLGGHAIFADKYDSTGLWIENQWGTGWGLNGWAELTWSFVNTYGEEAVSATSANSGPTNTPTVVGTATATAIARQTATAAAQQTATARVNATATARANNTATALMNQTATAIARQTATAAAQQTATARANLTAIAAVNNTATAQVNQTATASAHQTATAGAQQTATARANLTATAAVNNTATAVTRQTATAVAAQTVQANNTATAIARQTATAVAQQTATARANLMATAAVNNTATAQVNQTATAVARQTATALAQQTATARANLTATAAVNNTATAVTRQTATAIAQQIATAVVQQTAMARATAVANNTTTAVAQQTAVAAQTATASSGS